MYVHVNKSVSTVMKSTNSTKLSNEIGSLGNGVNATHHDQERSARGQLRRLTGALPPFDYCARVRYLLEVIVHRRLLPRRISSGIFCIQIQSFSKDIMTR